MKKPTFSGPQDILVIFSRRRWWTIIPVIVLSALVVFVAYQLPNIYVSEALILLEPRDVPDDFVRDLINVSPPERLLTLQQTVLSRSNLVNIVEQYGDIGELNGLSKAEQVSRLAEKIQIDFPLPRRGEPGIMYLRIAYENEDPEVAREITQHLANLFIEYDDITRTERVAGTNQFLEMELQRVGRELSEVETQLSQQKEQYRYELPDSLETNLRTLDRLQEQQRTNAESLDRSIALRLSLEQQLSSVPRHLVEEVTIEKGSPGSKTSLVAAYREKLGAYLQAQSRYKAIHPDVRRLKAELEQLRAQIPPEHLAAVTEPERATNEIINPAYQNLQAQLNEVKTEIKIREDQRKWIEQQIARYSSRVQRTAQHEQALAPTIRRHEELNSQYSDLKYKLAQAKLAESLKETAGDSHFAILDAATYPYAPSKPNRLLIILFGVFGSLGLGLAMAFGADVLDQRIWSQNELEKLLGVPVLVEIPEIMTENDRQRHRKKRIVSGVLLTLFVIALVAGLYLLHLNPELTGFLEPYLYAINI